MTGVGSKSDSFKEKLEGYRDKLDSYRPKSAAYAQDKDEKRDRGVIKLPGILDVPLSPDVKDEFRDVQKAKISSELTQEDVDFYESLLEKRNRSWEKRRLESERFKRELAKHSYQGQTGDYNPEVDEDPDQEPKTLSNTYKKRRFFEPPPDTTTTTTTTSSSKNKIIVKPKSTTTTSSSSSREKLLNGYSSSEEEP